MVKDLSNHKDNNERRIEMIYSRYFKKRKHEQTVYCRQIN